MTSSDARDLEALCDRILILQNGHAAKMLVGPEQCTEEAIIKGSLSVSPETLVGEETVADGRAGT